MGNEKDETFFSRWSRRKAQVRQEAAPLAPPVAEAEQPAPPVAATVLATAPVAAAEVAETTERSEAGGPPVAPSTELAEDPALDVILTADFWPLHVQSKPASATLLARSPDRSIAWFATSRAMSVLGAFSSSWRTDVVIAEDVATERRIEIETGRSYLDLWK